MNANTFEIVPIDPELAQSSFDLVTRVFVGGSTLHQALGVSLQAYQSYLWPSFNEMIGEGLSVAAIDRETGKVLGCLIGTDFHNQFTENQNSEPSLAPMLALTNELCRQYAAIYQVRAKETLLVDMGAVAAGARGQGLYRKMRGRVHEIVKAKGFTKVVGELSSAATQHFVVDRLGHEIVCQVDFASFRYQGGHPFADITHPPAIVLAQGTL